MNNDTNTYKKLLNRNIKLFYISRFITGFLFTIPIWVAFHLRFLNYSQIALLLSFGYFITFILEIPTGALADIIGRKKTIVMGNLLTGVARFFIAFAVNPVMLIVGTVIEGVGTALISGADNAIMYDSLKDLGKEKEYAKVTSRSFLLRRIGLVVASFTGGYLYEYFVGLPYILRGTSYLLAGTLSLFLIEPHIDSIKFSIKGYIQQTKEGIKELTQNKYIRSLTVYYVITAGVAWVCLDYFVNTFAKDSGYTEIEQSWAFALIYLISGILIAFITEKISHKISKEKAFILIPTVIVLSLLPGIFAGKLLVFFLILGINTSDAFIDSVLANYVNEELTSKNRATALSTLNLLVSGFYMTVLTISGPFQDIYSNKVVWSALGVLTLIVVIPTLKTLLHRHRKNL